MSNSVFDKLKIIADKAIKAKTKEESIKHLSLAFSLFSKETTRFCSVYQNMQNRLDLIKNELNKNQNSLNSKVLDLKSISSYLNNILNNISQGIIFIDKDFIITTFNNEAEKILNIDENKILFNSFNIFFKDDFFGFSIKDSIKYKSAKNLNYITYNNKEIEVTTSFVKDIKKDHIGLIIMLKDITSIKQYQKNINLNDRLKEIGSMQNLLSNEMKNSLSKIRSNASLLFRDLEDNMNLKNLSFNILENIKSLETLVNNITHFSKPINLNFQKTDIIKLINNLIAEVKNDNTLSNKIKIDFHFSNKEIFLLLDQEKIKKAFFNLLINSYQKMDSGLIW
jgi:PAS domain S-box-containing protein